MDSERLTPYLRHRCLNLRVGDRVALVRALQASLAKAAKENRLEDLARTMRKISGVDIRERCRRSDYVRARTVFSFVAIREGFAQNTVARFLGLNHATVHYQDKRMTRAFQFPAKWTDHIQLYNQFTTEIL